MFDHHRPAGEMPLNWRFAGIITVFRLRARDDGPLLAQFGSSLPSSDKKKNVVRDGPPPEKLTGSAHDLDLLAH